MIKISEARRFRMPQILIGYIPTILVVIVSVAGILASVMLNSSESLFMGIASGLLLVGMISILIFVLFHTPLLQANPYIVRLIEGFGGVKHLDQTQSFFVQLRFVPRISGGLRAIVDDADDIGLLTIDNNSVSYIGDRIEFVIKPENLVSVNRVNGPVFYSGLMTRTRVMMKVQEKDTISMIEIFDRGSKSLSEFNANTSVLCSRFQEAFADKWLAEPGVMQEGSK